MTATATKEPPRKAIPWDPAARARIPILAAATDLLAEGYWVVLIHPGQKRPIGKEWGLERNTDESLLSLYNWARSKNAGVEPGVGVCIGPGRAPDGEWQIDVEGDGEGAEESRAKLLGGDPVLSRGWSSARGGHQLFTVDEERIRALLPKLKARESKDANQPGVYKFPELPGLEIRISGYKSDGTTVKQLQSVVPPTPGTDGKPREWNGVETVAPAPEAFYSMLESLAPAPKAKATDRPKKGGKRAYGSSGGGYGQTAIDREVAAVASAAIGERNSTLNTAAFNLGQLVGGEVLDRDMVVTALANAAERAGLDEAEIGPTIASGLKAGEAEPRGVPPLVKTANASGMSSSASTDPYPLTDTGNAERLVKLADGQIRYCFPWKKWLVWDTWRWAIDDTGAIRRFAKQTARSMYAEAAAEEDDDPRGGLASWAMECEEKKRIVAMIDLATSEEGVPVLPHMLDRDPWVLNCRNGTVDLKTGKLRPHDPRDLITKLAPVDYLPDAECPLFMETLKTFLVVDELIEFWQRLCGMATTGVVEDHILPICFGEGSNGKSTLLNILIETCGPDYAMKAVPDLLIAKRGETHPTDRADLFGKRIVVAIETAEGQRLNESLIKEFTGGDKIRARRMKEDFWEFDPTHTVFLATNYKPKVRGDDHGIWRRLKMIPFSVKMPDDKARKNVPQLLKAERAGILAWMVRGCLDWQANGLRPPASVTAATEEYRAGEDTFGQFFDEHCIKKDSHEYRVKAGHVYARYKAWTESAHLPTVSLTEFGKKMEQRGIEKKKLSTVWYLGLILRSPQEPDEDDDDTTARDTSGDLGQFSGVNGVSAYREGSRGKSIPSVPECPKPGRLDALSRSWKDTLAGWPPHWHAHWETKFDEKKTAGIPWPDAELEAFHEVAAEIRHEELAAAGSRFD